MGRFDACSKLFPRSCPKLKNHTRSMRRGPRDASVAQTKTRIYSEPHESNSRPISLRISNLRFSLQTVSSFMFLSEMFMHFSSSPSLIQAYQPHLPLFNHPNTIWWNTNYQTPHYVIFLHSLHHLLYIPPGNNTRFASCLYTHHRSNGELSPLFLNLNTRGSEWSASGLGHFIPLKGPPIAIT